MNIELKEGKTYGLVAYTDGGARPTNPGPSGMGVHGYIYDCDRVRKDKEKTKVYNFTDGDTLRYAVPTDMGYMFSSKLGELAPQKEQLHTVAKDVKPEFFFELSGSSSNQFTNNYVELMAFFQVLQVLVTTGIRKADVQSDSRYVVDGLMHPSYCPFWVTNGWLKKDGNPPANLEEWKAVWKTYQHLLQEGLELNLRWIKAHAGHPGNEDADVLATMGVFSSRRGIDATEMKYLTAKKYWDPDKDRHPLLSLSRLYFPRVAEHNVPGVYYMADVGDKEHLIGKPMAESSYAVVRLKEPNANIASVLAKQATIGQDFNEIMMLRMDDIYNTRTYRNLKLHGESYLIKDPSSTNVLTFHKTPVTVERKPIGITMRAIDSMNYLESRLDDYLEMIKDPEGFKLLNNLNLNYFDYTDTLYDRVTKRLPGNKTKESHELKKEFVVGYTKHSVTFDVEFSDKNRSITVPLLMGLDLPNRNAMKRLETENPVVRLIYWRDAELSLRYATVLECDSGIAVWSNFFADRLVFKKGN